MWRRFSIYMLIIYAAARRRVRVALREMIMTRDVVDYIYKTLFSAAVYTGRRPRDIGESVRSLLLRYSPYGLRLSPRSKVLRSRVILALRGIYGRRRQYRNTNRTLLPRSATTEHAWNGNIRPVCRRSWHIMKAQRATAMPSPHFRRSFRGRHPQKRRMEHLMPMPATSIAACFFSIAIRRHAFLKSTSQRYFIDNSRYILASHDALVALRTLWENFCRSIIDYAYSARFPHGRPHARCYCRYFCHIYAIHDCPA